MQLSLAPNEYIHGFSRKLPDLVIFAKNSGGEVNACFHIEIQTQTESNMGFRMYDYGSIIGRSLSSDGEQLITFPHKATDDQVIQAAKTARADDFIRQLPKGYQTEVGEGGMLLSGGQRQLIAFARATLTASPILILDEATSSVDAATEFQMQQALDQLVMGRTSVIIAHRFTTLRKAKRIIVVDQGQIVGYDTHERLLEHCEVYKQLYEKQYK